MYNIKQFWDKYGFEIIFLASIIIIIVLIVLRLGSKGTWDNFIIKMSNGSSLNNEPIKKIPKESKGETRCRQILENIFNKPFSKSRPDFLRNSVTGNTYNLELDCYNSELNIALEYNGIQHYKFVPYFHKNKEAFYNQKYRDYMKKRICEDNKIILIEVPYNIPYDNLETYITSELKKIQVN